tara:strand:+ start:215 stop:427 length:213 start_codon:yes stop_codon:yes gene_type:complete
MKTKQPTYWRSCKKPRINIVSKPDKQQRKQNIFDNLPHNKDNQKRQSMFFKDAFKMRPLKVMQLMGNPMP